MKNILSYIRNPVSLETPVGEDGEDSLGDFVEDRSETDAGRCDGRSCQERRSTRTS